jgi:hypothetical protein
VNIVESIADRRIRAAREAGMFDNLPGAGKPIPDLGRERPPGWWGARLVKRERSIMKAEQLDRQVRSAMPQLWRLPSEAEVRAKIRELNQAIDAYNEVTTWERRDRLSPDELVGSWRSMISR